MKEFYAKPGYDVLRTRMLEEVRKRGGGGSLLVDAS
jgi:hypothetical protein